VAASWYLVVPLATPITRSYASSSGAFELDPIESVEDHDGQPTYALVAIDKGVVAD